MLDGKLLWKQAAEVCHICFLGNCALTLHAFSVLLLIVLTDVVFEKQIDEAFTYKGRTI